MSGTMPFGKHRGTPLEDIPLDYLQWLITLDLLEPLRREVVRELDARQPDAGARKRSRGWRQESAPDTQWGQPCPAPDVADELISAGLKVLARRHHPDAGGDHEAMVAVTRTAEWLRALTRQVAA